MFLPIIFDNFLRIIVIEVDVEINEYLKISVEKWEINDILINKYVTNMIIFKNVELPWRYMCQHCHSNQDSIKNSYASLSLTVPHCILMEACNCPY